MSIFDPNSLYYNRRYDTRKGQVLQKKITNDYGRCLTQKDIKDCIRYLSEQGYLVVSPGKGFNVNMVDQASGLYTSIVSEDVLYTPGEQKEFKLSDVWSLVKSDFQYLLDIPSDLVNAVEFTFSLVSFNIFGAINVDQSTGHYSFGNVDIIYKLPAQASTTYSTIAFSAADGAVVDFSILSYDNNRYLENDRIPGLKTLARTYPYLAEDVVSNASILEILKNEDWGQYDPVFMTYSFTRAENPNDPIIFSNIVPQFYITLKVNHKNTVR